MTPSDPKLRQRARNKAQTAIRAGRLTRPSQCEECGRLSNPDAHHPDYTRPLAVEWLCAWCHRARHPSLPGISQRKKPITIQLEPDLIEEIDRAAKHVGTSRQEWIAAACRDAFGPSLVVTEEMVRRAFAEINVGDAWLNLRAALEAALSLPERESRDHV